MESFFKNRPVIAKAPCECAESDADGNSAAGHLFETLDDKEAAAGESETQVEQREILSADAEGFRVELTQENNVITHIVVTCPCGKEIDLACHYEAAPAPEQDE